MGKLVGFADLAYDAVAPGVRRAPITGDEMRELAAEALRLLPGACLAEAVPAGSDRYLFTLTGAVTLVGRDRSWAMDEEAFAVAQEGTVLRLENPGGAPALVIGVLAPPPGRGAGRPGFAGGLAVVGRAAAPVHDVPREKKRRTYFVGEEAAPSERAHAMIVEYVRETVTALHMHPDADSMFVFLSGRTRFTIDGRDAIVGRGQAACLPAGDFHGLSVAEGTGVSFLEFHIPAVYGTVRA